MKVTKVTLVAMEKSDRTQFILDNQKAFRFGAYEGTDGEYEHFDENGEIISPEEIEEAMDRKNAETYRIRTDGQNVGGAILTINPQTKHNELTLFFVSPAFQGRGVGYSAWREIEKLYPETEVWDTCTPYFDKRNIHFYINKCGFHAVEFFCAYHPDPNDHEDATDDEGDMMFRFEKVIK